MRVEIVHPDMARVAGAFLKPLIRRAADASHETAESLIDLAEQGKADFWVIYDGPSPLGVCFTQLMQGAKGRHVHVLALGGSRGVRWLKVLRRAVHRDGKAHGATKATMVRLTGRKTFFGLKPTGYYFEDHF